MVFEFLKNVDLQSLVKWIGKSDIFVQILGIVVYSFATEWDFIDVLNKIHLIQNSTDCNFFSFLIQHHSKNHTSCELYFSDLTEASSSTLAIFVHIIELCIALKLVKGAEKRDELVANKWLLMTVLLTTVEGVMNAAEITLSINDNRNYILIYSIPEIIFKLVSCGVVKSYVKEVRYMKTIYTNAIEEADGNNEVFENSNDRQPIII